MTSCSCHIPSASVGQRIGPWSHILSCCVARGFGQAHLVEHHRSSVAFKFDQYLLDLRTKPTAIGYMQDLRQRTHPNLDRK